MEKESISTNIISPAQTNPSRVTNKEDKSPIRRQLPSFKHFAPPKVRTEIFEIISKVIYTPQLVLKLYLLIFVLVTSGLASYTVVQSFMSYFAYEVTTVSRTLLETPTLFPKVTICNLNMFTSEHAFHFLKKLDSQASHGLFDSPANLTYDESSSMASMLYFKAKCIVNGKHLSEQQKKTLAHSLDEILLSCTFDDKPCNASDFSWTFDPFYGNCYAFNNGLNSNIMR